MNLFIKILPVILLFFLGYLLRKLKIFKPSDADIFLKLVFYVSLPALILFSVSRIQLKMEFYFLPLASFIIFFATFGVAWLAGKKLALKREQFGVLLVSTMIMNNSFVLPFVYQGLGNDGLARLFIFDLANGFLSFTFAYYISCKYGSNHLQRGKMFMKFVASPPIWALVIALFLNFAKIKIHETVFDFLQITGNMTFPLVMLSLGIYFSPKIKAYKPVFAAILIRFVVGFLVGLLLVRIFNPDPLSKVIILTCATAPAGFNTLVFASMEKLDKELASSILSFSLLAGMIITPLIIYFYG